MGQGTYGKVAKAVHIKSRKRVAIKLMTDLFDDEYNSKRLVSEIQILRKLSDIPNNQFTSKIFDIITPDFDPDSDELLPCLFIVMDYVETDLKKVLNEQD